MATPTTATPVTTLFHKCESNADCDDDKPYCDIKNGNTCKGCHEAFGEEKTYRNETSCAECPSGTWSINKNKCIVGECENNVDCQALKGSDNYYSIFTDQAVVASNQIKITIMKKHL